MCDPPSTPKHVPTTAAPAPGSWYRLPHGKLQALLDALAAAGHRVVGPQVADGAVVLRDLTDAAQLPHGWLDEQDGGFYRLRHDPSAGVFDHVVGPHSLKNFLFPPRETLQRWNRGSEGWQEVPLPEASAPLAVVGVRACDLAALAVQDAVFIRPDHTDAAYAARRDRLFLVAVNCRRAVATCFCHSMGCGPAVRDGFDLALTETDDGFAVEVGSTRGATILSDVATRASVAPLSPSEIAAARAVPAALAGRMHARTAPTGRWHAEVGSGSADPADEIAVTDQATPRPRSLDTEGIRDLLFTNLEHPRWQQVAERCLSCTNCTLVCPTCFCHSVTEVADLSGDHVDRDRQWASCFSLDHGRVHGGNARPTTASRYRQWLVHKLAGWIDQFGTSGCTGCGRCITWCPVGIDITEEVAAIRETSGAVASPPPS
jgi:sulfhydrogenase subunit beta (sulfur reductase)